MRLKLILICLLFVIKINGQSDPNKSKLPEYAPVSPEAHSLGTYGNIPVNLSVGKINYTVPIHTVKVNNFELPIFLNYNYDGLKIQDMPDRMGLGWSLNAGGVLIRERRGLDDFLLSYGYIGGDIGKDEVLPLINSEVPANLISQKLFNFSTNFWDGKPDKFIVNANNISAKFYFNENEEIVFRPKVNYKMERNVAGSNEEYILTDDAGIKYFFGGNYIEMTTNSSLEGWNGQDIPYATAYLLHKIEFPNSSQTIQFEYESYNTYHVTFSQIKTELMEGQTLGACPSNIQNNPTVDTHDVYTTIDTNGWLLNKITYPAGEVAFERDIANPINVLKKTVKNITVKDFTTNEISKFNFTYNRFTNSEFFVLKNIDKVKNLLTEKYFEFDYYNENSLPTLSNKYQQDFYGYLNSNPLNQELIIRDGIDHRQPDFEKVKTGALKKITYPTGGFTEIEYESNTVIKDEDSSMFINADACNDFYNTTLNSVSVQTNTNGNPPTLPYNQSAILNVSNQSNATLKLDVHYLIEGITDSNGGFDGELFFKKVGQNTPSPESPNFDFFNSTSTFCEPETYNNNFNFTIGFSITYEELGNNSLLVNKILFFDNVPTGSYEISVNVENTPNNNNSNLSMTLSSMNENEVLVALETFDKTPINVGGIRVKETIDCVNAQNCIEKNYSYHLENGYSSGKLINRPILYRNYKYITMTQCPGVDAPHLAGMPWLDEWYSFSKSTSSNFEGMPFIYGKVDVIRKYSVGEDKISNYFNNDWSSNGGFPYEPVQDRSFEFGRLIKKEIYDKQNNLIAKDTTIYQIKNYDINNTTNNRVLGLASQSTIGGGYIGGSFNDTFGQNFMLFSYQAYSENYLPIESTSRSFYNTNEVMTKTNYVYDDETGYLKTKETTTNNNEKQKVELTYPYEKTDAISQAMTTKNMISSPIETESYRIEDSGNQQLLSTQKTIYQEFGVNDLLLPSIIQTAKGEITANNPLEDLIIFHNYDQYSNPTEVSKINGKHIFYIWGYNHSQPVAKIEGLDNIPVNITQPFDTLDYSVESNVISALTTLRNSTALTNTMITTFTYKPLIGVSTITDPKRDKQTYHYDEFNRLQFVKDSQGNILSKNEYHYRN